MGVGANNETAVDNRMTRTIKPGKASLITSGNDSHG